MNYIFYFSLMPIVVFLSYLTFPERWKNTRKKKIISVVVCLGMVICSYVTLVIPLFSDEIPIKNFFINLTLILALIATSSILFFVIRYVTVYNLISHGKYEIAVKILSEKTYIISSVMIALFFLAFGHFHFIRCITTEYDVSMTESDETCLSQCKIGLVADVHIGSGTTVKHSRRICDALRNGNFDVICISGDVVDHFSSEYETLYFVEKLSSVKTKYGIYFADGNHEKEAHVDIKKMLSEIGVVCLSDEAVKLENGLIIVGRDNNSDTKVSEILSRSGLTDNGNTVVIQHKPEGLKEMSDCAYLVLSGHTHGYQLPELVLFYPYIYENPYGYHEFGSLKSITTSGASAWVYRIKWPSNNEVVSVNLTFEGVTV